MALPVFQTDDQTLMLMQTRWKFQIDHLLANPRSQSLYLKNITVASGLNYINHLLGRMQQGWAVTDINAAVALYRSSPFTSNVLTLTSSGAAVISLEVW